MSTQSTTDTNDESEGRASDLLARGRTVIERHGRSGSIALAGGAALLVRSIRKVRGGGARGMAAALAGIALLGVGLRQRRGQDDGGGTLDDGNLDTETETSPDAGDDEDVSDDARAELERPAPGVDADEENPREPGAPADDEEEGDVQFMREQGEGVEPKPDPNEAGAEDPRHDVDSDDAAVEIDISEAAMADESGEAAGPTSQQSEPTSTRNDPTEPEDSDEESVTEDAADKRISPDAEAGEDRDEKETDDGTTIHTDTNEAGTIDVDEDDVTEPDHDLNEEPAESDEQSSERLDDQDDEDETAAGATGEDEDRNEDEGES